MPATMPADAPETSAAGSAGRITEAISPASRIESSLPFDSPSKHGAIIGITTVSLAIFVSQLPLLLKFFSSLNDRPQYQFYPLLLISAVWLAVDRLGDYPVAAFRRGGSIVSSIFISLSLMCALAGAILYVRWFAWPASLLMLAGAVWRIGGGTLARLLLPIGILLLTILPPPGHSDQLLLTKLQHTAVVGSSRLLDLLGIPNLIGGTTIEIPQRRLLVEQACSGINSVVSISAFTLLFCFYNRRSVARIAMLLCTSIGFVLLINLMRIVLSAAILYWWKIDLLEPTVHGVVDLVMFGIGLGLTLSADQLFEIVGTQFGLTRHRPQISVAQPMVSSSGGLRLSQPGWQWWAVAFCSLAIGGFTYARVKDCWPASRLSGSAMFVPPARAGDWHLVQGAGSVTQRLESVARYQQRWVYRDGGTFAEVSFAYPFNALHHDAAECYEYTGWNVLGRTNRVDNAGVLNTVTLDKPGESRGYLVFGAFDETGRPDVIPDRDAGLGFVRQALAFSREAAMHQPSCEVQALEVSPQQLDANHQENLQQLFMAVRDQLKSQTIAKVSQ